MNEILKNEFNLGESGFYYVRMKFADENMPLNWFDVVQVDDYITDMTYGKEWRENPEIIYTLSNGLQLSHTEIFKTKEQALQHAKELNEARVRSYLYNVREATNFLGERELLAIDDRFVKFLMEINARYNALEKTEENKKPREQVNTYEIPEILKELLLIDYNPHCKQNYLDIVNITEEHKYFKTIKKWLEENK